MPAIGAQPRNSANRSAREIRQRGKVGQTGIVNLAGAHQIVEGAQDFLHRRHAVGEVRPVKIDAIRLQPFETSFDGAHHVLAAVAGARDAIGGRRSQRILGGENKIIAIRGDEVADYFFGLTELIAVCRIDEVAAGFDVAVKNFFCFASLGAVTPARAEVAGA